MRHPRRTLFVILGLTLVAAPGLFRLELRTDGSALVPTTAPEVVADQEVRAAFDLRDPLAVVIRSEHPRGALNQATLRRLMALTQGMGHIEGIRPTDITSLATEVGFRHVPGKLTFAGLLEAFPDSDEKLELLASDLDRIGLYDGTLVSADRSAVTILVGVPPEADRPALIDAVQELISTTNDLSPDDAVAVLGAPVAEALLGSHILSDLGVPSTALAGVAELEPLAGGHETFGRTIGMVPVAILVMLAVFLIAFRRPAAALLPLSEVAVCLTVVFGTMGWLGSPVYLTTAVLPVILTAIGVADEIHIFRRYLDHSAANPREHDAIVLGAVLSVASPVIRTSLTTAVAFLSFALSPLEAVRNFGLYTALGVMVCLLFSLSGIPAAMTVLGPRAMTNRRPRSGPAEWRVWLPAGVRFLVRRRFAVVMSTAAIIGLAAFAAARVEVQDSWLSGFDRNSALARASRWFDHQFLGSHQLFLAVEAEAPRLEGTVAEEFLGQASLRLPGTASGSLKGLNGSWLKVTELEQSRHVGGPRTWTTWIDAVRLEGSSIVLELAKRGGSPRMWLQPRSGEQLAYELWKEPFVTPELLAAVKQLEVFLSERPGVGGVLGPAGFLETAGFMLRPDIPGARRLPLELKAAANLWRNYTVIRGPERVHQLINQERSRVLVTAYLEEASFVNSVDLIAAVQDYAQDHLSPLGLRIVTAGDVAVSCAMIKAVISTQVRSVALSLLSIFVITALLHRSLATGLCCVAPPAAAVVMIFATMGLFSVPLGVATSMFASMTLGVGIDFALHLVSRYRQERERGLMLEPALVEALNCTGPAILTDALAVGLGFGVLVLSSVPANARLGGLLMASVLASLVATFILVPALLAWIDGEKSVA